MWHIKTTVIIYLANINKRIAGSIYSQRCYKTKIFTVNRGIILLHFFFFAKNLLSHECIYTLTEQFHSQETILRKFPTVGNMLNLCHIYMVWYHLDIKNHVLEACLMAWENADNKMLNDFLQKVIKLNKEHEFHFIITLEVINQKYSSSDKIAKACW